MNYSHRVLLEGIYAAIEDAGYDPEGLSEGKVGTFVGCTGSDSMVQDMSHYSMLGSETSILAARIAFFLNLKGPALTVNTSCSSSLVAMDLAYQKLMNGEIDLALSGGITIFTHPASCVMMNNAGMLSPSGRCQPFDDGADGIVIGDGMGVVILKRLSQAVAEEDHIYGVIRGIGTNQDGRTSGITVPSFTSQSELEQSVYSTFSISPEEIHYIETHGTATKLGDPVEIHALTQGVSAFYIEKTILCCWIC